MVLKMGSEAERVLDGGREEERRDVQDAYVLTVGQEGEWRCAPL